MTRLLAQVGEPCNIVKATLPIYLLQANKDIWSVTDSNSLSRADKLILNPNFSYTLIRLDRSDKPNTHFGNFNQIRDTLYLYSSEKSVLPIGIVQIGMCVYVISQKYGANMK